MQLDLAVIGQGAVSPAGIGVEALFRGTTTPTPAVELRRPETTWPVLRVDLKSPELLRWQREPRLRRCSPLTLFLVEAAAQALAGISPADRAQTGLIITFSAGCLAHSRRFFEGTIREGRKMASPALFPETVFNSPASHVAAALKLNGAAYALVGDETSWISALQTAAIWLGGGRVKYVLVLGGEEFDSLVLDAYASARWLRRQGTSILPSEGAGGVLLRPAQVGDTRVITGACDGFIYRTRKEAVLAAGMLSRSINTELPCYPTAQNTWLAALEKKTLGNRTLKLEREFPNLGQAFTASTGWNLIRALDLIPERPALALPIWGTNHQFGLLELTSRGAT